MENKRKVVIPNFWKPFSRYTDPTLYRDELGWTPELKIESGGYTDTYDVWEHLIAHDDLNAVGFDLGFYYIGNGKMYYLDNIDQTIYEVPENPNWNGSYMIEKYQYPESRFSKSEAEDVFLFDKPSEVWDNFKIDDKDMKYILEHSVLFLDT